MKKIAIVTATRAEYGILKPLIRALNGEPEFDVRLIVTGAHLLKEFGETYKEIEEDKISIAAKIPISMNTESGYDISHSMAQITEKFAEYFLNNKPDLVILLGDRYEIPAFAIAAVNERIPIAHIAGGETTEGAIDEVYRHAVTKMSYLHFTSTEEYRRRVIQMGESPDRVFNVGSMTIENIKRLKKLPKSELEEFLGIKLIRPFGLVTFHPVTLEENTARSQASELIDAMATLEEYDFVCTKANADIGGMLINEMLEEAADKYDNIFLYSSLGQIRYMSLMQEAAFVLGNTSSGLGEAPAFAVPTINVGDRQKGRIKALSVIDCKPEKNEIIESIRRAGSKEFSDVLRNMKNPYGDGDTSSKIVRILKDYLNNGIDLKKKFYDLEATK